MAPCDVKALILRVLMINRHGYSRVKWSSILALPSLSPLRSPRSPSSRLPVLPRRPLCLLLLPGRRTPLPRLLPRTPLEPPLIDLLSILAVHRHLMHLHGILHRTRHTLLVLRLRLLHIPCRVTRLQGGLCLLSARRVKVRGHALPAVVGARGELLHRGLAGDVVLLLLDRGCFSAGVAEPLMPLRCASPVSNSSSTGRCWIYIRVTFTSER